MKDLDRSVDKIRRKIKALDLKYESLLYDTRRALDRARYAEPIEELEYIEAELLAALEHLRNAQNPLERFPLYIPASCAEN